MKPILTAAVGIFLAAASFCISPAVASAADGPAQSTETPAQRDARMAWFREARFGLFIHWGLYSVPAGEYKGKNTYGEWFLEETKMPVSQYEKYAREFNPVKFEAKQWVSLATNAGMKYIVITSKHHDGFGMFRSELTDWCVKSTPFNRDPLKELAAACKEVGVTLCFYHSIMDWHHPDWATRRAWNDLSTNAPDMDRYTAYMKGQLKELLTNYGPIGILWFDGEWESPWTHERGVDLYNYVRGLQPNIIVNNRVGKARAGMGGMDQGKDRIGDYGTPEQEIPATGFGPGVDWESCMTMNNHWGYNKADQNWKSASVLVRNLIDCSSKGGNYLLNVGPTSEGLFPEASVQRLNQIGAWMKVNSESIYGTTASPFKKLAWGRCTQKPGMLYLHVFDWPADGKVAAPIGNAIKKAWLLSAPGVALKTENSDAGQIIFCPAAAPDAISSVIAVQIDGAPEVIAAPALRQSADGSLTLPASEGVCHGKLRFETGDEHIGYWTDSADWVEWQFKVTHPGKFAITANLASLGTGSFEMTLAGQTFKGIAPNTGSYGSYKLVELGTVELKAPGNVTLTVKALPAGWAPLNIKTIKITPAN